MCGPWCGDPPPKRGRLPQPLDHLDPVGGLFIPPRGLRVGQSGRGEPVHFRDLRRDDAHLCCGPATNLMLAGIGVGSWHAARYALGVAPNVSPNFAFTLLLLIQVFVTLNLTLMLFNLLPIGPLDGVKVVQWFLPQRLAEEYYAFNARYGGLL